MCLCGGGTGYGGGGKGPVAVLLARMHHTRHVHTPPRRQPPQQTHALLHPRHAPRVPPPPPTPAPAGPGRAGRPCAPDRWAEGVAEGGVGGRRCWGGGEGRV